MIDRLLKLPSTPKRSFFLWGPRQTGKSTLLRQTYPEAIAIDLLKSDEFIRYQSNPSLLRSELLKERPKQIVVIDEVQKVPLLLNEVQWLIENKHIVFGLCGSSARKLRRGHGNLLGGRALRFELLGFASAELENQFDLKRMINQGYLPPLYLAAPEEWPGIIRAYTSDYLKEEIAAEGLVRNLPAFTHFLSAAALSDAEPVNFSTIARDIGVSSHTVREYFEILIDTLQGFWVPAYTKRPKRRVREAAKFFFADVGVVNYLNRRGELQAGSELFGKAFENWVFHELQTYNLYQQKDCAIAYWRLASGIEVDFIVGDMEIAIEVKSSQQIQASHLKGLREVAAEYPKVKRRIVISMESKVRYTEDGIEIWPAANFANALWAGEIF